MRIANEEVFGPVLSVLKSKDEEAMFEQVNAVDYGLTSRIWATNVANAYRAGRAGGLRRRRRSRPRTAGVELDTRHVEV
jgi:acyl-CoA reductase-like NAD-dependent aldehyde dehydrogenase